MRTGRILVVAAMLGCLAGCADSGSTPPISSPELVPAVPSSQVDIPGLPLPPVPLPGEPVPAPDDTVPKQAGASPGAALTVTDIRLSRHPGFDRVEYILGGEGTPGWSVWYTGRAIQDGSGRELEVAGQSVLEVRITGSAYPFDSMVEPYAGPDPATDPAVPGIAGVYRNTVFEGVTQSFVGVAADEPGFTVAAAAMPNRLVIDIATG
ncbi:AMIN-like domain-containing (lipo)protein [Nocardia sp. NBC_00416]|uniref:AMIN-like domain-containing (lipo)protein n=1 Tax=Nocardia sp. NBC_00416 TaxID=2975991 RepID=UPI002E1E1F90